MNTKFTILMILLSFIAFGAEANLRSAKRKNPSYERYAWNGKDDFQETAEKLVKLYELHKITIKDTSNWCPRYNSFNKEMKILFHSAFLGAVARAENYQMKPELGFKESFSHNRCRLGNGSILPAGKVRSRGLLQVSNCSCQGYKKFNRLGKSMVYSSSSLHKVEPNLNCGAAIMSKWLRKDSVLAGAKGGNLLRGAGRYWSTLRSLNKRKEVWKTLRKSMPNCSK